MKILIIGELINASNKSVQKAIINHDEEFVTNLAEKQAASGAHYIDVNVATGKGEQKQEIEDMDWAVKIIQEKVDKPICIDTTDYKVLEAGLKAHKGQAMINSISHEGGRLQEFLDLASEYGAKSIALPITEKGIPSTFEERLEVCEKIIEESVKNNYNKEDLYFDPLVLPISVDTQNGLITMKTLEGIKSMEAKTTIGLSNLSFGMPERELLNKAFLLIVMQYLDSVIMNPLDQEMKKLIIAGNAVLGRDKMCMNYLRAYRNKEL
ncbi:MAG: methyltetrahydrofolate cobalamin methyltransferase [Candidatus Syntrophonatronum acetioxidans]|uniref:Methyltetrahydrofolate cobalamin methyltransferase n=1 Tax=Candidatus Syntrophonatronum acetioxidans TaxID=1795816 RepID=A0A424YBM6_9FIRM|nr:MAG: methyltetrahydrofolate cobalamin methyltransferase [Candidatus Syntrophonatronum acetioxidans]